MLSLTTEPFSLRELVQQVVQLVEEPARRKGINIDWRVQADLPANLFGDPRRLRQVLLNLAGNAVKFTEAGHVSLRVNANPRGSVNGITFTVEDTGPGMAPEELVRMFAAFAQGSAASTAQQGTGLGLNISRKLVELMGGRMEVSSQKGKGSTFRVHVDLPVAKVSSVQPNRSEAAVDLRGLSILLVDDNADSRLVAETYLQATGCFVTTAENGAEGASKAEEGNFDVILMDMQMPVLDGCGATRRLRAFERERGTKPVPIIALTADAFRQRVEEAMEAGCTTYLTKPIRKEILLRELSKVVRDDGRHSSEAPTKERHDPTAPPNLETLLNGVEPAIRRLLPNYLAHRTEDIALLHAAIASDDFAAIASIGHKMKGTGTSYGLPRITEIGSVLEAAGKAGSAEQTRAALDKLIVLVRNMQFVLSAGSAEGPPMQKASGTFERTLHDDDKGEAQPSPLRPVVAERRR